MNFIPRSEKILKLPFLLLIGLLAGAAPSFSQTDDRPAEPKGEHQAFWEFYRTWQPEEREIPGAPGVLPPPLQKRQQRAGPVREVFGYLPYWFRDRWNLLDYGLLSTIAYFSGEAAADGSIGDTHGWPRSPGDPSANSSVLSMIDTAHQNGVRVVLCITLFDGNAIHTLVSTPSYRNTFIEQTLSLVEAGNGDGININFEGILSQSSAAVTQFMVELADSFHSRMPGSQVSCAPTDYDTRSGDWDIAAIYPSVDLFFFQGYGYGWSGSSTTRPVGLLPNTSFWGSLNITTFIDFVLARIPPDKVVLGLPHYGRRWPAASPDPNTATQGTGVAFYYPDALGYINSHGRLWDALALNPWFRFQDSALQWYQGWYDDPESMSHKYQFALNRDLAGVGMWALGMDGANHDIWDVLGQYFADSTFVQPPRQPVLSLAKDTSGAAEGRVLLRWSISFQPELGGFRVYQGTDPSAPTTLIADESTLDPSARSVVISGLGLDSTYYFRLEAVNTTGEVTSDPTDTYGVRTGSGPRYLIVDGFTRITGSYTFTSHPFNAAYAEPLSQANRWFDSADRDAAGRQEVNLGDYAGVFWFVGDNSTADRSLAPAHQQVIASYLENGGKLFITGSELGYDLDRSASPNNNPAWYAAYLKARYAGDKADGLSYSGSGGSIFDGLSGQFGQVYPEDWPDYVTTSGGSVKCLDYNAMQIAGISYAGSFGTGSAEGRLVYVGFAFETIASLAQRTDLVERTLSFLEGSVLAESPDRPPLTFHLEQNFPNPFNPSTVIGYQLSVTSRVTLKVYDVLGKEVARLVDGEKPTGAYRVEWNADASSGVYFYRLEAVGPGGERFAETKRMLLVR